MWKFLIGGAVATGLSIFALTGMMTIYMIMASPSGEVIVDGAMLPSDKGVYKGEAVFSVSGDISVRGMASKDYHGTVHEKSEALAGITSFKDAIIKTSEDWAEVDYYGNAYMKSNSKSSSKQVDNGGESGHLTEKQQEVAQQVFDCLTGELDFSDVAACAVIGNMEGESGLRPDAIEAGGGGGHGLCQWTGGRWDKLNAFANSKGKSWKDVDVQCEFLVKELKGAESMGDFSESQNIEEAVEKFMREFERPASWVYKDSLPRRIKAAKAALALFGGTSSGNNKINNLTLYTYIDWSKQVDPTTLQESALSGTPQERAVAWARMIANDNSFNYGSQPGNHSREHQYGCYFCGTNITGPKHAAKGSRWEKTYCCNPFVNAAYAHGAGEPKCLEACKKCSGGGTSPGSWTRYGCFKNMGHLKYKQLRVGDILVKDGGNHACLYGGNNEIIEAGSHGWGASTISVKKNAKGRLGGYTVVRYTGQGGPSDVGGFNSGFNFGNVKKKSLHSVVKSKGVSSCSVPQCFAAIDANTFVICYSNKSDSAAVFKKYQNGKCVSTSSKIGGLGHANGLTYNPNTGCLYSVSRFSSRVTIIDASSWKVKKKINVSNGVSAIAYDKSTGKWCLRSGEKILIKNKLQGKTKKTINISTFNHTQDMGAGNGIVYSCYSPQKFKKNKIVAYNIKSGEKLGTYTLNFGETEGFDVAGGSMFVLSNESGWDHIYKAGTGGGGAEVKVKKKYNSQLDQYVKPKEEYDKKQGKKVIVWYVNIGKGVQTKCKTKEAAYNEAMKQVNNIIASGGNPGTGYSLPKKKITWAVKEITTVISGYFYCKITGAADGWPVEAEGYAYKDEDDSIIIHTEGYYGFKGKGKDKNAGGGNSSIADAAVSIAYETRDEGVGNNGTPTYRSIHDQVIPRDGIYQSCDRTVCTAVRWAGADDSFPPGACDSIESYLGSHPDKWARVTGIKDESSLKPGDVFICSRHTFIYTGNEAVKKKYPKSNANTVSGSFSGPSRSPGCDKYTFNCTGSMCKPSWDNRWYKVYRNKKMETNSKYKDAKPKK